MELSLLSKKLPTSLIRKFLQFDSWSVSGKGSTRCAIGTSVTSRRYHNHSEPVLSPVEVTRILQAHEKAFHIGSEEDASVIQSFEMNQLPSNDPMEDYHLHAKCLLTPGLFNTYRCSYILLVSISLSTILRSFQACSSACSTATVAVLAPGSSPSVSTRTSPPRFSLTKSSSAKRETWC